MNKIKNRQAHVDTDTGEIIEDPVNDSGLRAKKIQDMIKGLDKPKD